jgi:hypothetical protein
VPQDSTLQHTHDEVAAAIAAAEASSNPGAGAARPAEPVTEFDAESADVPEPAVGDSPQHRAGTNTPQGDPGEPSAQ